MNGNLVSVDELAAQADGDVLLVDCRFDLADPSRGRRDFLAGHLPGAVYADLDRDLSDPGRQGEGLGRHPLPRPAAFAELLARWGWRPDLPVVAYDAAGGALAAARLWWMLKTWGATAAVLDGGIAAWQAAGLSLEAGEARPRDATVVSMPVWHAEAMIDHAAAAVAAARGTLVDARAAPRYRGDVEPLDPVAGHVPGALNRPFTLNLDDRGHFRPAAALRREWLALLGDHAIGEVVHMCGSGVTAAHNLLAMEHAGLTGSRLYPPSWSGWISERGRPTATGD